MCRLACSRTERTDKGTKHRQERAALAVMAFVQTVQSRWFRGFCGLGNPSEGAGGGCEALAVPAGAVTVQIFSHQFDSAKQRLKAEVPAHARLPGEENCEAYVTKCVMMQQAQLRRCCFGANGSSESAGEPYLMEGTVVEQQNADFYLESLLRRLP